LTLISIRLEMLALEKEESGVLFGYFESASRLARRLALPIRLDGKSTPSRRNGED
jgi:hypothetical protein